MAFQKVAIAGAGISGLTLALLLTQSEFDVTVYEMKGPKNASHGALTLCPNGLKVLGAVDRGLINQIRSNGYRFQDFTFRNHEHQYLDAYEVGSEAKYGHDAYRVYRDVVTEALRTLVDQAGISMRYNTKISGIVSEDENAETVTFAIDDGTQQQVNLLIGADGIHSEIRRHLFPDMRPVWSGAAAISCAASYAAIKFPNDLYKVDLPVSIHVPSGAVHIAPQDAQGTELMAAIQWVTQEQSREGWSELGQDRLQLRNIMKSKCYESEIAVAIIEAAADDTFFIWPFYTVPRLHKWCSEAGRVLIVGDAAHGIPPTGGQGANQALEDAYSLCILLTAVRDHRVNWEPSVRWWHSMRQERVDKVIEVATEIRRRRQPGWNGQNVASMDSSWLLGMDVLQTVQAWIDQQQRSSAKLSASRPDI